LPFQQPRDRGEISATKTRPEKKSRSSISTFITANGTQAAFEDDPTVFSSACHQDPRTCYPGSGHAYETGVGAGEGFTLNIPFDPGSGDDEYLAAFDNVVVPRLDDFRRKSC